MLVRSRSDDFSWGNISETILQEAESVDARVVLSLRLEDDCEALRTDMWEEGKKIDRLGSLLGSRSLLVGCLEPRAHFCDRERTVASLLQGACEARPLNLLPNVHIHPYLFLW